MGMNRLISRDEVLMLKQGDSVYVEHRDPDDAKAWNGIHTVDRADERFLLVDLNGDYWPILSTDVIDRRIRVWALPQPPTPEELASAPPWNELQSPT